MLLKLWIRFLLHLWQIKRLQHINCYNRLVLLASRKSKASHIQLVQQQPYKHDATSNNNKTMTADIITYWNGAAGLVVGVPLVLYWVVKLLLGLQGQGGERGGWLREFLDGPEEERWQGVGAALAYLWSLAVFGVLTWRGKRVLQLGKDIRALFVALVMWSNLAFLCFLLVTTRGGRRQGEEEAWMGQFAAVEILTFLFMTVFGVGFASLLHDKARGDSSPTAAASSYSLWGNDTTNDNKQASTDNDGIM